MRILNLSYLFTFTILLSSFNLIAQSLSLPANMGDSINSQYAELNPIVSPDGKTIYFVRVNHPENNFGKEDSQDIWYSTLGNNGTWSHAERMPFPFNTARYNSIYSISEDGNTVLMNGVYSKNVKWIKRGLSVSRRTSTGWEKPERLKVRKYSRKNKGSSSNAFLSADGQTLLLNYTRKFNGRKLNIYYSQTKENGKWRRPKKIAKPVNTRRSEEAPFLSADNKTLYFASNRGKGNKKNYNIYYCTRLGESWKKWSEPKLLSDSINTANWESYFKTTKNGSHAYFASNQAATKGEADIFKVKLFEENPFVIVRGNVVNKTTNTPVDSTDKYTIYVNGVKSDSAKVNPATGAFEVKLPLGKKYLLKAIVDNYTSSEEEVNVSDRREFTEVNKNLPVTPLAYLIVEGNILVKEDKSLIADTAHPYIFLNDVKVDSAIVSGKKGRYKLTLPYGKKYNVEVRAEGYNTLIQTFDFSSINKFRKVEQALYVGKIKKVALITVSGKVIDVKTNKALDSSKPFEIFVDQKPSSSVSINSETSEYTLTLAPGSKYTVNASVQNYYPVYEVIDLTSEKAETLKKDLPVAPIEVGQSIKLNNILFQTGNAVLKKSSFTELDKVVQFLKDNSTIKIEIDGHTDNVGNAAANMKLSESRAVAVANYITKAGIPKDRIAAKGFGMTKPVASNSTAEGKSQNRRVEFTILEK